MIHGDYLYGKYDYLNFARHQLRVILIITIVKVSDWPLDKTRYTEDSIKMIIAGAKRKSSYNKDKPSMLIDIQKAMAEGKGIGYQNWAKSFNLKQMAKTFAFLQENNLLSYETLEKEIEKEKKELDELNSIIDSSQKRLEEITTLTKHIRNYKSYNSIYAEYKKLNKPVSFKEKHETELDKYMDAKRYFDSVSAGKKLPTLKELNEEYQLALSRKKDAINKRIPLNKEYRKHLIYQENARVLLDIDKPKLQSVRGNER